MAWKIDRHGGGTDLGVLLLTVDQNLFLLEFFVAFVGVSHVTDSKDILPRLVPARAAVLRRLCCSEKRQRKGMAVMREGC